MHRFVARLALVTTLCACGGASLPALGGRAVVVPSVPDPPTTCPDEDGKRVDPRSSSDLEKRMRGYFMLPNGAPDLEACRAVCARALAPGDAIVSCHRATSHVRLGCYAGGKCPEPDKLRRAEFCGDEGRRTAADPIAAQRAIPFDAADLDQVIVCNLR